MEMTAQRGLPPFASVGTVWRTFVDGQTYHDFATATGVAPTATGTYGYQRLGANQAVLTIQGTANLQVVLMFRSANAGTYIAGLAENPMANQQGQFTLTPAPALPTTGTDLGVPADTPAATTPATATASDQLRAEVQAKGIKDQIFAEREFSLLFKDPYFEKCTPASLAFAYEARQSKPDYQTLAALSTHAFQVVYANDEFRRRSWLEENLPHFAAKLNRAASPVVIAFTQQQAATEYDFQTGGFRVFNDLPLVTGFSPYGMEFSNQKEAAFFKIPENEAAGIAFKRRSEPGANHIFQIYAVAEGLGTPSPKYPKVVKMRIIGIAMSLGKWNIGYYNLATGQWKDSYSTTRETKAALEALKLTPIE